MSGLILPQIAEFLRAPVSDREESKPEEKEQSAELLLRIAGSLATASDAAAATRLVASEGVKILPFDHLAFALKLDGDRVALLHPGERKATLTPVAGTPLARILKSGRPGAMFSDPKGRQMIVPLRGAGRVHGALIFGASKAALDQSHLGLAQQLADIVASHLELLRHAALRMPPYVPVWRRTEKA